MPPGRSDLLTLARIRGISTAEDREGRERDMTVSCWEVKDGKSDD